MLQTDGCAIILRAFGVGHCQHTAEQRVLTQILVGASASGDALDVDSRTQYHVLATQTGLAAHAFSISVSPLCAPCGSQCRTRGEERGRVGSQVGGVPRVGFHFFADTKGTVSIFHIGDAESRDACRGEHVLSMQHLDLLFECHLLDDVVNLCLMSEQFAGIRLRLCGDG